MYIYTCVYVCVCVCTRRLSPFSAAPYNLVSRHPCFAEKSFSVERAGRSAHIHKHTHTHTKLI